MWTDARPVKGLTEAAEEGTGGLIISANFDTETALLHRSSLPPLEMRIYSCPDMSAWPSDGGEYVYHYIAPHKYSNLHRTHITTY